MRSPHPPPRCCDPATFCISSSQPELAAAYDPHIASICFYRVDHDRWRLATTVPVDATSAQHACTAVHLIPRHGKVPSSPPPQPAAEDLAVFASPLSAAEWLLLVTLRSHILLYRVEQAADDSAEVTCEMLWNGTAEHDIMAAYLAPSGRQFVTLESKPCQPAECVKVWRVEPGEKEIKYSRVGHPCAVVSIAWTGLYDQTPGGIETDESDAANPATFIVAEHTKLFLEPRLVTMAVDGVGRVWQSHSTVNGQQEYFLQFVLDPTEWVDHSPPSPDDFPIESPSLFTWIRDDLVANAWKNVDTLIRPTMVQRRAFNCGVYGQLWQQRTSWQELSKFHHHYLLRVSTSGDVTFWSVQQEIQLMIQQSHRRGRVVPRIVAMFHAGAQLTLELSKYFSSNSRVLSTWVSSAELTCQSPRYFPPTTLWSIRTVAHSGGDGSHVQYQLFQVDLAAFLPVYNAHPTMPLRPIYACSPVDSKDILSLSACYEPESSAIMKSGVTFVYALFRDGTIKRGQDFDHQSQVQLSCLPNAVIWDDLFYNCFPPTERPVSVAMDDGAILYIYNELHEYHFGLLLPGSNLHRGSFSINHSEKIVLWSRITQHSAFPHSFQLCGIDIFGKVAATLGLTATEGRLEIKHLPYRQVPDISANTYRQQSKYFAAQQTLLGLDSVVWMVAKDHLKVIYFCESDGLCYTDHYLDLNNSFELRQAKAHSSGFFSIVHEVVVNGVKKHHITVGNVCWASMTVKLEDTVAIFVAQPGAMDWFMTASGEPLLAVMWGGRLLVFVRQRGTAKMNSWCLLLDYTVSKDHENNATPHVQWTANGGLIFVEQHYLRLRNFFGRAPAVDLPLNIDAAVSMEITQSTQQRITTAASDVGGALPEYHPTVLVNFLIAGRFDWVEGIIRHLDDHLPESSTEQVFLPCLPATFYLDTLLTSQDSSKSIDDIDAIGDQAPTGSAANLFDTCVVAEAKPVERMSLSDRLMAIKVPRLNGREQMELLAVVDTFSKLEKHRVSLDENAVRFLAALKLQMFHDKLDPRKARTESMPMQDILWAFHSESQAKLLQVCNELYGDKMTWKQAAQIGIGFWVRDLDLLKKQVEVIARNQFMGSPAEVVQGVTATETRDPTQCALFYLALGKKKLWQQLWKMPSSTTHPEHASMTKFLANDFAEDRWRQASLKNAFVLLGRQRFEYAAAFFLLGGSVRDAMNVCIKQLADVQLAYVVFRCSTETSGVPLSTVTGLSPSKTSAGGQIYTEASALEAILGAVNEKASKSCDRWLSSWLWWKRGEFQKCCWSLLLPPDQIADAGVLSEMPTKATPDSPPTYAAWILFQFMAKNLKRTRRVHITLPPSVADNDSKTSCVWWRMVEDLFSRGLSISGLDVLRQGISSDLLDYSVAKPQVLPAATAAIATGIIVDTSLKSPNLVSNLINGEPAKPLSLFDDEPAKPLSLFDDEPPKQLSLFDDEPKKPLSLFDEEPRKPLSLFDDDDDLPKKPVSLFDDEDEPKKSALLAADIEIDSESKEQPQATTSEWSMICNSLRDRCELKSRCMWLLTFISPYVQTLESSKETVQEAIISGWKQLASMLLPSSVAGSERNCDLMLAEFAQETAQITALLRLISAGIGDIEVTYQCAFKEAVRLCRSDTISTAETIILARSVGLLLELGVSSKTSPRHLILMVYCALLKAGFNEFNFSISLKLALGIDTLMRELASTSTSLTRLIMHIVGDASVNDVDKLLPSFTLKPADMEIDEFEMEHAGTVICKLVADLLRLGWSEHIGRCIELFTTSLDAADVQLRDFFVLELLQPQLERTIAMCKEFDCTYRGDSVTTPSVELIQLLPHIPDRRLYKYLESQTHRLGLFEFQSRVNLLAGVVVIPNAEAPGHYSSSATKTQTLQRNASELFTEQVNDAKAGFAKLVQKLAITSHSGRGSTSSTGSGGGGSGVQQRTPSQGGQTTAILHI